jgi:hypothetical protein
MLGSAPQNAIKPNWVAEPVRWYTQMPNEAPPQTDEVYNLAPT